jgi:hypothetical protein
MANWIPITIDDLNDARIAALVTAYRTKALGPGQSDPTPRIVQAVVDRIRRKVASCRTNLLDLDPTTIPKGLKEMAVLFIIVDLKGRLEEELSNDEQRAIDRFTADLNRIANCDDVVEQPDNPIDAPVQATAGSPTISEGRREQRNRERTGL